MTSQFPEDPVASGEVFCCLVQAGVEVVGREVLVGAWVDGKRGN